MKTSWRMRFLMWLRYDILMVPEGAEGPKWLITLYKILFPIQSSSNRIMGITYDPVSNRYDIFGQKFTYEWLRWFSQFLRENPIAQLELNNCLNKYKSGEG